MPVFLRVLINRGVGETPATQKAAGLWGEIDYRADKLAHPDRQLYTSQARDSELQAWQQDKLPKKRRRVAGAPQRKS
jgi:hypothetical protein